MKIKGNIKVVAFIIIILLGFSSILVINNYSYIWETNDNYVATPRYVNVNDYEFVRIDEETMVKTYFSIFINNSIEEPERAYNLLDKEYRELKYPTLDSFNEYIKKITEDYTIYPEISTYKTDYKNDKTIYYVYDKNKNEYIFSVEAVMVYTVYLDEETMEIE